MIKDESKVNKGIDADAFQPFVDKVCFVQTKRGTATGKLLYIGDPFLTLEHRSGRISIVRKDQVISVTEIPQRTEAV